MIYNDTGAGNELYNTTTYYIAPLVNAHMRICTLPFRPGRQKEEDLTCSSLWYRRTVDAYAVNENGMAWSVRRNSTTLFLVCNNQSSRGNSVDKLLKLQRIRQELRD